jgi:pyruvate formate lyase activating enzyme
MLKEGAVGLCGVRRNLGGKIRSLNYGIVSGIAVDPIEKKPLYHFFPGKKILSVGSVGCNLKCNFCQNWQISQNCDETQIGGSEVELDDLIDRAIITGNNMGLAYTYNEPTVWYEMMFDLAVKAHEKSLKNVVVTNGYINMEPLKQLIPYIDAFNIDLKGFTPDFYRQMASGTLPPVLNTLKTIKKHGKHLEVTNLIIPGKNDDEMVFKEMINWIANELGEDTVLHLSRYFPRYKQTIPSTNQEALNGLAQIAREQLNHVYIGNVQGDINNDTHCANCKAVLIYRTNYNIRFSENYAKGKCLKCNTIQIPYDNMA